MIDDVPASDALDRLDTAWDDMNHGVRVRHAGLGTSDETVLRALVADRAVAVTTARSVWMAVIGAPNRSSRVTVRRSAFRGGTNSASSVVAGSGWLPAGLTAGVVAAVILGGVLFGDSRQPRNAPVLPGDASSVMATLVPAAPAGGTPGKEGPSSMIPMVDENG